MRAKPFVSRRYGTGKPIVTGTNSRKTGFDDDWHGIASFSLFAGFWAVVVLLMERQGEFMGSNDQQNFERFRNV
jgi:hypothetical protein